MKAPLFITGIGRSGTTLLQSMFNAHPELAFPPETHFLKRHVVPELSGKLDRTSKDAFIARIAQSEELQRTGWDLKAWAERHWEDAPGRFQKLYRSFLEEWAEQEAVERPGDKDPMLVEYLPHLHHCFPDAYLIHIIRDPRDVALSRIRSGWGKGRSLLGHLCEHRTLFDKVRKDGPRYFGDRYIELYYEELLQAPENSLKKLCERLPVDYEPAMLNYEGAAEQLVQGDEGEWKKNVLGPLLEKNLGKWKKEMPKGKLRVTESALRQTIEDAGYEKSNAYSGWTAFWLMLPLSLSGLLFSAKFYRERVRRDG
ncbi:MAG: sulfotransferase [Flavobacteriales bacterium]